MKKKLLLGIISLILTNTCFLVAATENDEKKEPNINPPQDEQDDVPVVSPVKYFLVLAVEKNVQNKSSYHYDVLKLKNEDLKKTLTDFYQTKASNMSDEGEMDEGLSHKMFFERTGNSLSTYSWKEYDDDLTDLTPLLYNDTKDALQNIFKDEEGPSSQGINITAGLDSLPIYGGQSGGQSAEQIYKDVRSKLLPKINNLETSFLSRHRNKFIWGVISLVVLGAGYWVLSSSKKEQTEVGDKYEDE